MYLKAKGLEECWVCERSRDCIAKLIWHSGLIGIQCLHENALHDHIVACCIYGTWAVPWLFSREVKWLLRSATRPRLLHSSHDCSVEPFTAWTSSRMF